MTGDCCSFALKLHSPNKLLEVATAILISNNFTNVLR